VDLLRLGNQQRAAAAPVGASAPSAAAGALALRSNQLLTSLTGGELESLITAGSWNRYAEGGLITSQGAENEGIYFITQGRAKAEVSSQTRAAYRAVLRLLGPGDDVGLLGVLDDAPHSASVVALQPVEGLLVPLVTMRELLLGHPEWYEHLAKVAVTRLRASTQWLQALI
jgi:CRP/FNR family cyclic AMP-dependent transcriptional regulator